MACSLDKHYSISIDSLYTDLTGSIGSAYIFVAWYTTPDGSGYADYSDTLIRLPVNLGEWTSHQVVWDPPLGANSFRVDLYISKTEASILYFDNLKVEEITPIYQTNGSGIISTISSSGDDITVESTDDSNPDVTVNNRYDLNVHSPNITYTSTLIYKNSVTVSEERFDFIIPSQTATVMTRGLNLTDFDITREYYSDLYTPKVARFENGISFSDSDTMQSMRLRAGGSHSQVSFWADYAANHPFFYYIKNGSGARADISAQKYSIGDSCTASITFSISPGITPKSLVKTRQPSGYDAVLVLTNHADVETLAAINAVAYGTEDTSSPDYGNRGILSRGIGWTKSTFLSGQPSPYMDLSNPAFKALTDKMYQDGAEIIAHSITDGTDSRAVVEAGMQTLSQYGARNWIDHGAAAGDSNWEDLGSQGTIKGDENYTLDLFDSYGYDYAWSYQDYKTSNYSLNILFPSITEKKAPFFYYNNNVDDNPGDARKIYLWSTMRTNGEVDTYYSQQNIDNLITQRGVHIGHEYIGSTDALNRAWYTNPGNNKVEIYPAFDDRLAYIASRRDANLLWTPTMVQLGDYLRLLPNVSIVLNPNGTYTVTNNNSTAINDLTLLAEMPIESVTLDGSPLTTFGGSYGSNEVVISELSAGQSAIIAIGGITANLSVGLQGGSRPDSGYEIPLTVKLFTPDSDVITATPVYTFTPTTAKSNGLAVAQCTGIAPGTYDLTVVSEHTLLNVKRNVNITALSTSVDMGILLEGNADNNTIIDISDFGILAVAFNASSGQPGYDARADFDRNGIVDISDFGLLAVNFNQISPVTVP